MTVEWLKTKKKASDIREGLVNRISRRKRHFDEELVFTTRWKNIFIMTILDEGHRLRHLSTKTYASIIQLEAIIDGLFTATPGMNTPLVRLLDLQIDVRHGC